MRRLAALAGACALLLLASTPALAGAAVTPRASVLGLENDLVCIQCHEPLNMSTSPLAQQMKAYIRRFVSDGWTTAQVEAYFVAHFGPQVLAVPPTHGFNLLAWVIPLAVGGAGLVAAGTGAWVWSRRREEGGNARLATAGGPPLAPGLELRVDQELARFDG